MPLRTWIIDDEELARARLRLLLRDCPSVQVLREFTSAQAAVPQLLVDQPDLIFLDVRMPGMTGMEFATSLKNEYRVAIIFVTAFEEFAVSAFAVNAVDYLVKPFDRERLMQAVERAQEWVTRTSPTLATNREQAVPADPPVEERLAVRVDGEILFIRHGEIEWIEAANNYVVIHRTNGKRLMVRMTLAALGQRLPAPRFLRVNRSCIVNTGHVGAIKPADHGDYMVVLHAGTAFRISRSRRSELLRLAKSGGDIANGGVKLFSTAPGSADVNDSPLPAAQ